MADEHPLSVNERLAALGLTLPPVPTPVGRFQLGRIDGDLLYLSGQGPVLEFGPTRHRQGRTRRDRRSRPSPRDAHWPGAARRRRDDARRSLASDRDREADRFRQRHGRFRAAPFRYRRMFGTSASGSWRSRTTCAICDRSRFPAGWNYSGDRGDRANFAAGLAAARYSRLGTVRLSAAAPPVTSAAKARLSERRSPPGSKATMKREVSPQSDRRTARIRPSRTHRTAA